MQRFLQFARHGRCNWKLSKDRLRLCPQRNFSQNFLSILRVIWWAHVLCVIRFAVGCNIRQKDIFQDWSKLMFYNRFVYFKKNVENTNWSTIWVLTLIIHVFFNKKNRCNFCIARKDSLGNAVIYSIYQRSIKHRLG